MSRKRVLLTGASGSMGGAALRVLLERRDRFEIVLLLLDAPAERRKMKWVTNEKGVEVVWGDLRNPEDVRRAVKGVDHVLHPAAFISPAADHQPNKAKEINYGGTTNLLEAVASEPDGLARISFVYISSVAGYGGRLPPVETVRVGDPLRPSVGDFYATTKVAAERAVIESGLRRWAVLRQTWIAIPNLVSLMDPIMFHQPLDTCIELITQADAGYGLIQSLDCTDDFYGRVYNMSGGPSCRVVYTELLERTWRDLGLGDYRRSMNRNWFALRNFHCCFYADSGELDAHLGHFRHGLEDYYRGVLAAFPGVLKLGCKIAPAPIVKLVMRAMADPMKWLRAGHDARVDAFFGGRDRWEAIGDWSSYPGDMDGRPMPEPPLTTPDDPSELAKLRGGECLSPEMSEPGAKHKWTCGLGHTWEATATCMRAGHWCPECAPPPWDWDTIAKIDPLIGKYHYVTHRPDEHQKVERLFGADEK